MAENCTGGETCCTPTNPCDVDEGDCDSDSDCKAGLKCGSRNCKTKSGLQWDVKDDCCYEPGKDMTNICKNNKTYISHYKVIQNYPSYCS